MSKIDDDCNLKYVEAKEKIRNRWKEEAGEYKPDECNPDYRRAAVMRETIRELKNEGIPISTSWCRDSTLSEEDARNCALNAVGYIESFKKFTPEDCPENLRAKAKKWAVELSKAYGDESLVDYCYKVASIHLAAVVYLKGKLQKNEEKLYPDREKDTVMERYLRDYPNSGR